MPESPFSLSYRMPAEWERHAATWLSWPKNPTTFSRDIIEKVENIYLRMVGELSRGERVNIVVDDAASEKRISGMLNSAKSVSFYKIPTVDVWIRDYGPIFVKNREVAAVKWTFNAWGGKYDDLEPDSDNGLRVARSSGAKIFEPEMVLEGGSIDVNGLGTCITTKQCLLNRNRNPNLNQKQIEENLKRYLGITNLIWLESGVAGDDTDGHVDDIARFVDKKTIICMSERNHEDENYGALKTNYELLLDSKDQDGEKINAVQLQMPRRIEAEDGRLPASYANFYIGNSTVLVPTFNDPSDAFVLKTLESFFRDRSVVGINCEALVYGFGGIHCVTQQQPL